MAKTPTKPSILRKLIWSLAGLLLITAAAAGSFYRSDIPRQQMRARWADESSQFLDILGSEVHVKDHRPDGHPEAPTLVLLHGTASSLHTWNAWASELGDTYRIVRWDLQGYGLTGPNPDADYTIDRQIHVGEEILNRLGIESATIGGNSLGGYVAWRWALVHPERLERLILVDAAGYPMSSLASENGEPLPERKSNALSLGTIPVVKDLITKITPRFVVKNAVIDVYGRPDRVDPRVVQRHYEMLLAAGNRQALQDALAQRRDAPPAEVELWKQIPRIQQPTLILWGQLDDWIPLAMGKKFHQDLPNSKLVVYPDGGHVSMEELPVESARDVREWLMQSFAASSDS